MSCALSAELVLGALGTVGDGAALVAEIAPVARATAGRSCETMAAAESSDGAFATLLLSSFEVPKRAAVAWGGRARKADEPFVAFAGTLAVREALFISIATGGAKRAVFCSFDIRIFSNRTYGAGQGLYGSGWVVKELASGA